MNKVLKLFILLKCKLYIKALFKGCAAAIEHENVLLDLDCDFILDVGANKGQFALVSRHCLPNVKIISFEPLEEPSKIFENVFLLDKQVIIHHCAIGDIDKETEIHVSEREDSSSLLPITKNQELLFPGTGEKLTKKINVKRLNSIMSVDDIIGRALLKIDVQGFELSVLKGASDLLERFQYVYVECSFVELYLKQSLAYEVIQFLQNYGFVLSGVYNTAYDSNGIAIQADFLFENSNK